MKEYPDIELKQEDGTFFDTLESKRKSAKAELYRQALKDFQKSIPIATEWSGSKSGWGFKEKRLEELMNPYAVPSLKHTDIYSTKDKQLFSGLSAMNVYKDPNSIYRKESNAFKSKAPKYTPPFAVMNPKKGEFNMEGMTI